MSAILLRNENLLGFIAIKIQMFINNILFQIRTTEDLWTWISDILIPGMFNTKNYNGNQRSKEMYGTLPDSVSYLLGNMIFRQIRTENGKSS